MLAYRVVYEDHQDDDIQEQYKRAIEEIGATLEEKGANLDGLESELEEAETIYKNAPDTRTDYNNEVTIVVSVMVVAFLVIAVVVCRDWRMFGVVMLENVYILILLGLVLLVYYAGLKEYLMVTWFHMADRIAEGS